MVGGLGPCGRPLCCAQWLRTFDPVGIKVAKDQGLSLNPTKISGICDRLMCCLRYEHEVYRELAARLPQVGDQVKSQGRIGRVEHVTLLRERVTVRLEDGDVAQTIEINAQDLRRARGYWLHVSGRPASGLPAAQGLEWSGVRRSGPSVSAQAMRPAEGRGDNGPATQAKVLPEAGDSQRTKRESRRRGRAQRGRPQEAQRAQAAPPEQALPKEGDARRGGNQVPAREPAADVRQEQPAPAPGQSRPRRRAWRRFRPHRGPAPRDAGGSAPAPPADEAS